MKDWTYVFTFPRWLDGHTVDGVTLNGSGADVPWHMLNVRACNILDIAGLKTIDSVVRVGTRGLLQLRSCGKRTARQIREAIGEVSGIWMEPV